ncbi:MAG TPA: flagellar filament capping protein FliD [Terracidiphilus sp.]|jgi:flagellar hook-associated protein 2
MGTVGLSFGSPTSGQGFDVSSTVSSIVANLQNVETPWKTQLTSLESQDTAISSLGTLFSNLSNDMSALTDFQGILSEKTGSSSDTNVLTLTAADATAVAGTYTVEVGNLAQTSSGYLVQISNASDTIAGSVTLQAGSGTAVTVTVSSSDNTLAGLAAAINTSGAGITASVLTDSSGSRLSLVSGTSGANGNIAVTANTLAATDSAALSYSAATVNDTEASTGTLTALANSADTLSGNLSIQVGSGTAQTIVIGAQPSSGAAANTIYTGSGVNTLTGLMDAINSAGIGVTASVIDNSSGAPSLSLTSNTTGSAGTLSVASSLNDITGTTALAYTSPVSGEDANLTVDGVALTSASNTVADLIPGVTFQLLAPSTTGEQVQVVIGNDNTDVESTVGQMVTDYNSLISAMNTQEGTDSSGNPEPLFGSPTLTLLQQQLLSGLNSLNPNGYLTSIANSSDTLSGSISIAVGSGTPESIVIGAAPSSPAANTIYTGSGVNTLSGLAGAINSAGIGVTANVVTTSTGSQLELVSDTTGSSGTLTVTSAITDATTSTALRYNGSGTDINSLTSLGISVNNDGSLTLDVGSLDSVLNSDYSGVVGFFQNSNGWGQTFSTMLTNSGMSTGTGILALSSSSNSNIESTLNADISKENSVISAQQTSLTAELNSANEIMQQLPTELDGVNELYSAITGYNQSSNG